MTDDGGPGPPASPGRPAPPPRKVTKATAKKARSAKKAVPGSAKKAVPAKKPALGPAKEAAPAKKAVPGSAKKAAPDKKQALGPAKEAPAKAAPAKKGAGGEKAGPAKKGAGGRPAPAAARQERVAAAREAFLARRASASPPPPAAERSGPARRSGPAPARRATEPPHPTPPAPTPPAQSPPAPPPPPPAVGAPQWGAPQWPPPWPPAPPSARTVDGLAVAALPTGIVSIPLVITVFGSGLAGLAAVVLGVAALSRIRGDANRGGRGLAIGGIVTGAVGVVLTALVLLFPGEADDNELDTVSYRSLRVGDCYERDVSLLGVTLEDCEFGHDREVVGIVDHPAPPDAPFPGREELDRQAKELCGPLYGEYLGPDANHTLFVQQNLQPTPRSWRDGSRRIVCSVERLDKRPLVGSVKDGGGEFNE